MEGRENRESEKDGYRLLPHIMLALPRAHLHYSELVHCAAGTHSAHGISTRLLAKGTAVPLR